MSIELEIMKTAKVKAAEIQINCKVCDNFTAALVDDGGAEIASQCDGYVPGFMPGKHYGDYLILNIDLETGLVRNWTKPSAIDLQAFVEANLLRRDF